MKSSQRLFFLTSAFIIGIGAGRYLEPDTAYVFVFLALSFIPLLLGLIFRKNLDSISPLIVFFLLGIIYILPFTSTEVPQNHIKNYATGELVRVQGELLGTVEGRGKSLRLKIAAKRVQKNDTWLATTGSIFLTLRGDVESDKAVGMINGELMRGDLVSFSVRLKEPRNFGNPGEFDYEWWLMARGVSVLGRGSIDGIVKVRDGALSVMRMADALRIELRRFIDEGELANPGIIKALLIAEKGDIPDDVRESFIKAGNAHLLAISGLHVGFVCYFFYLIISRLLRMSEHLMLALNTKKLASLLALVPVILYGAMAGYPISTQRAVLMVACYVFLLMIGRVKMVYNIIAIAALVVLAISPASLWDVSFQLSFIAVLSILVIVPGVRHFIDFDAETDKLKKLTVRGRTLDKVLTAFYVTIAATIGTAPVLAWHFHRVSLAALYSNSVVVPITGMLTVPLLFISAILMPIWEGAARFVLAVADLTVSITVLLVNFFASIPLASIWVATPSVVEIIIFYLVLLTSILAISVRPSRRVIAMLVTAILIAILIDVAWRDIGTDELKVTYISVGQGDSALIEIPAFEGEPKKRMLIDGGGFYSKSFDTGERVIAPLLWKKKIEKIDYLVLSHAQRDHMGGLAFIAERFSPKEFWWNGMGELNERLGEALIREDVKVRVFSGRVEIVDINESRIEFINPVGSALADPIDVEVNLNEASLVMRIVYGDRAFIFTGDIGVESEKKIMASSDVKADVLKVSHHGSLNSSDAEFIDAIDAEYAVFSVGWKNRFSFPRKEVVRRFEEQGALTLRTDIHGAISFSTDGKNLELQLFD
jgi:competence protein ComEC